MKKKLAVLFAALSLCAFGFTGCGDDDDDDNNNQVTAQNDGAKCKSNAECKSDNCKKADGADADAEGVCAAKDVSGEGKANGSECLNNDECQSKNCEKAEGAADSDKGECKAAATGDGQKEIGEECTVHAGCKDSYCKKDAGADKGVCTALIADGQDCSDAAECSGGFCNSNKCASTEDVGGSKKKLNDKCTDNDECESGNCASDGAGKICKENPCVLFKPHCDNQTAYTSCDLENGPVSEPCKSPKICKTDNSTYARCEEESTTGDCLYDSDCFKANPAKPVCNKQYKCVARDVKDPCQGVSCSGGKCELGVCVTDAMKAFKADGSESCTKSSFVEFCKDDKVIYCGDDDKVHASNACAADGAGSCMIYELEGAKKADCSGSKESIDKCQETGMARLDLCYGTTNTIYESLCLVDLSNNVVAIPTYKDGDPRECKDSTPVCGYNDAGTAECKASK